MPLIALNFGQNSFLESHAVFVLSGVRPIGESAVVVDRCGRLDPDRDAGVGRGARRGDRRAPGRPSAPTICRRRSPRSSPQTRSSPRKTVTVGLGTLGLALAQRIEAVLGGKVPANDAYARELARIRSADGARRRAQGHRHRRARLSALPRVRAAGRARVRAGGRALLPHEASSAPRTIFCCSRASQHNLAVTAAGRRVLDVGDIILSEITPCYQGQFAQICRTTVIGAASAHPAREIRRASGGRCGAARPRRCRARRCAT